MKKASGIFTFFLLFSTLNFAQTGLKERLAGRYFAKYAYLDAIPFYEDLVAKDTNNIEFISRLCDCYRLTGNTKKTESCYSILTSKDNVEPINYFYYAQVLEENKKYSEAQKYFKIYNNKNTTDSRSGRKMSTSKTKNLWKDSSLYIVTNINFNSVNNDFGLFPYSDSSFMFASNRPNEISEKHIYIRDKQPFLDLYTVNKIQEGPFSVPQKLPRAVNSQYHEGPAFFDKNNNVLYLTRNNFDNGKYHKSKDGVNKLKIFMMKINDSKWVKSSEFEYNDDEYSVGHPTISVNGKRLYFSSDMPGGYGLADIYVCFKDGEKWGKPQNLGPEINTEGNELFPSISGDNKLYFSSDGNYGLGGLDIYRAEIINERILEIENLGFPINSNKDDFSFYIYPDNKFGYFSSNRFGGKGNDDIYAFQVTENHYFVSGNAVDKESGVPLPGTAISLSEENGTVVSQIITANEGSYRFEIEPGKNYKLDSKKEEYLDAHNFVSLKNTGSATEIEENIILEKDPGLFIYGLISDKLTKEPLADVNVLIIENSTNLEIVNVKTTVSGDFKESINGKKISDILSYNIKISKMGYLTKTIIYYKEVTALGVIKLQEALDITLDKIETGTEIGKLIDIKPVYFDISKWEIRLDAAVELDKIVKVMNGNPTIEIELGSHTDCRSSAAKNLTLSDKRAKASAEYIKKNISNPERITGKGYGESQPVNKCECEGGEVVPCTEKEHQMNRRTEFKVVNYSL